MTRLATIKGLDLVLAGGLHTVRKLDDQRESTVTLIRGAAGTGKTVFASHLAISEAAKRGGDVVYCCVELLPTELDAQLSNLTFGPEHLAVRVIHAGNEAGDAESPRLLASIIDVPPEGEPDFGGELKRSIETARTAHLDPKVLVIDSLSEGYRLGGSVSRLLADALSKFAAEEGLLLVLIEEVSDHHDSLWTFIADVVFELSHHGTFGTAAAEQRSLVVRKSRFGPSQVGPHSFTIRRAGGIEIYPRLSNYLNDWVRELIPGNIVSHRQPVRWNVGDNRILPSFPEPREVVLVTGTEAILVALTAVHLQQGVDVLRLDLDRMSFEIEDKAVSHWGNPFLGGEILMSMYWHRLVELRDRISAVVIGDLDSIRGNIDPIVLRQALPVLIWIAHEAGLAVMMLETHMEGSQPTAIHLADTVIEAKLTEEQTRSGEWSRSVTHRITSRRRVLIGRQPEDIGFR
jgi:KaiC/GvpD/RAD55 family RecA-like ATPase